MLKRLMAWIATIAILVAPIGPVGVASAKEPKYAKTEVEKAAGKCVGSVLGGALLGALVGRVVGGKRGTATGAVIGVGAGAAICGILMANAKHRDRIIEAQIAAAADPTRPHIDSWTDDNGQPVTFVAQAGPVTTVDGSQLIPVRYPTADGNKAVSPQLDTGGHECRPISGNIASGTSAAATPTQLFCRTSDGDYKPYSQPKA